MDKYKYRYYTHPLNDVDNKQLERETETPEQLLKDLNIKENTTGMVHVINKETDSVMCRYSIVAFATLYHHPVHKVNYTS
ncbi:hypothetical protein NC796_07460 [Aliifodinibius sp. S!AR15-10]|uniref:hypothetical protein n=1 Tax=Aliifodinibius sp. S!AR15-10 TaxID=2950437 RepID=UPI00285D8FD7|nr:hypothetical protein [Aliifodinibius sp. S!AR15-10]MDR8390969.1 hypothetical protein [Aliifodinibius sp. S!AR15-10]